MQNGPSCGGGTIDPENGCGESSGQDRQGATACASVPEPFITKRRQLANEICTHLQQGLEDAKCRHDAQRDQLHQELARLVAGSDESSSKLQLAGELRESLEHILSSHRLEEIQKATPRGPEEWEALLHISNDWAACIDRTCQVWSNNNCLSWVVGALQALKLDVQVVNALAVPPTDKKSLGLCRRASYQIGNGWAGWSADTILKKLVEHRMQMLHSQEERKKEREAIFRSVVDTEAARTFLTWSDHKMVSHQFFKMHC
jgi:hypothetical protein